MLYLARGLGVSCGFVRACPHSYYGVFAWAVCAAAFG
jgi:hypothetical protein